MKRIIAIVLALVIAAGLGGFAYAQANGHEPMYRQQKLVGWGTQGSTAGTDPDITTWCTCFSFTNPDCVSEIKILRIYIIRQDDTVLYEGPLLKQICPGDEVEESTPWTEPMQPHEIRAIDLGRYFPDPDDPDHEWMSWQEVNSLVHAGYTVEIFWKASHKKGLPLIGYATTVKFWRETPGNLENGVESAFSTPMVNLNQMLYPR